MFRDSARTRSVLFLRVPVCPRLRSITTSRWRSTGTVAATRESPARTPWPASISSTLVFSPSFSLSAGKEETSGGPQSSLLISGTSVSTPRLARLRGPCTASHTRTPSTTPCVRTPYLPPPLNLPPPVMMGLCRLSFRRTAFLARCDSDYNKIKYQAHVQQHHQARQSPAEIFLHDINPH